MIDLTTGEWLIGHREGGVVIGEAAALGCSLLTALTLLEA